MRKNPFETENETIADNADATPTIDLQKTETIPPLDSEDKQPELAFKPFEPSVKEKYENKPLFHKDKLNKRSVEQELTDDEYHDRLMELNKDAENKQYVLFFGQPASGKTWIIGSLLHYMKNYLGGTVYLDTEKTTESEEELFYQLQDRFNGVRFAEKITSTDTKQYFEFHISFTPKDSSKPPMNIVFIDASGEHSEQAFRNKYRTDSGKLPNYLTVILESDVHTKLAFVYDQSLQDEKGGVPQMNVLSEIFTKIQHIQASQKKFFPKALLLSKADRIYASDMSAVERNGYDPMLYALEKIPSFANSFFNESDSNKTIFYKMGTFSTNSDLLLEFDKECPEKLFRWLYMSGNNGASPIKEPTCWDKFMVWFKGSK